MQKIDEVLDSWLKTLQEKPIKAGIEAIVVIYILKSLFKKVLKPLIKEAQTLLDKNNDEE